MRLRLPGTVELGEMRAESAWLGVGVGSGVGSGLGLEEGRARHGVGHVTHGAGELGHEAHAGAVGDVQALVRGEGDAVSAEVGHDALVGGVRVRVRVRGEGLGLGLGLGWD